MVLLQRKFLVTTVEAVDKEQTRCSMVMGHLRGKQGRVGRRERETLAQTRVAEPPRGLRIRPSSL